MADNKEFVDVMSDTTGLKLLEEMQKNNALMAAIAAESAKTLASDWTGLERLANTGLFDTLYKIGDQFIDKWTDVAASNKEYDYPYQLNCMRDFELEDGTILSHRPLLQAHYAHPFGVQFSHQRAFLACPDGLSAGTYYFTIESKWGDEGYVLAGDVVAFTLTQNVPVGGRLSGCYGAPDNAKSTWKIYSHSADGKTVIETVTPVFATPEGAVNLGVQKYSTRNGNLNSTQEMAYGWNRWKMSAIRQYLNSDAGIGAWWAAQDEWDIAPDELKTKTGFLSGVPQEIINAMKPVKVVTYTNTVQDGGEADVTYDKVFLLSLEEIYASPQIKGEGEYHEYWKQKSGSTSPLQQYGIYPKMITYAVENHVSPQAVRVRSSYRGNAHYTWYVFTSGNVNHGNASWASRFSPAWVI